MVQEDALVPVVNEPTVSLALRFMTGEPVPQDDIAGVAPVLDAIRCPNWSMPYIASPVEVALTWKTFPVVEAVWSITCAVLNLSWMRSASCEDVEIVSALLSVDVAPLPFIVEVEVLPKKPVLNAEMSVVDACVTESVCVVAPL